MPRKVISTNCEGPFHVSARCINREWFKIPMAEVWDIFSAYVSFLKFGFNFEIYSFVLMNNHYHMIVSTPGYNLSKGMTYFQREVSHALNRQGNRINRTFAGRYHKCHITSFHYFKNCYKYVYQNPVRAGIVNRCELYPYSTLTGLLGAGHALIPVQEDTLLFGSDLESYLKWLNTKVSDENNDAIRKALKKGIFKLRKDPFSKTKHVLESELI